MNLDFKVHTFGCKVNTYDTGLIEKRLTLGGEFKISEEPRIHVLNTCAVTSEATLEAGRLARKLKSRDPFCLVVATGCAAQVDTDELSRQSAIDLIVANSHKTELQNILKQYYQGTLEGRIFKSNIFKKEDVEPGGGIDSLHTRSFLKIQDGCNSFCTFCVIPFARGKSRSIGIRDLNARIDELYAGGVREVVLTGVHIGDYDDNGKTLEDLVESVLAKTKMPRFRLTSLEPPELTPRLIEMYQDDRLCAHFHMSIQSAQTDVLRDMKRHYDSAEVERALNAIEKHVPNAFVGMDVIAGFPTETEEQFEETRLRLSQLPWTRLHVFPYSPRPGTYAARWPVHSGKVLNDRSGRLRELSDSRMEVRAQFQIGQRKRILRLRSRTGTAVGISRDFWTVELPHLPNDQDEFTGEITGVVSTKSHQATRLIAKLIG